MSKIDPQAQKQADTKRTTGLPTEVAYWATPRANDAEKRGTVTHRPNMPDLVGQAQTWPTQSASVANDGESPETWHTRAAKLKEKHGNGNGAGLPLTVAAAQWPTPAARDSKGTNSEEHCTATGGGGNTWTS